MNGMLFAEFAVFFELDTIGRVLFVLLAVVIALFAFGASQRDFVAHLKPPFRIAET